MCNFVVDVNSVFCLFFIFLWILVWFFIFLMWYLVVIIKCKCDKNSYLFMSNIIGMEKFEYWYK